MKRYIVFNKRSGKGVSEHCCPEKAAAAIVKSGTWTRCAIRRTDGAELSREELLRIDRTFYPTAIVDEDQAR